LLNNGLTLLGLLVIVNGPNGTVEVINSTSLGTRSAFGVTGMPLRIHTRMTGHRSLAETEAKLEESEVRYWAEGS